jgi:cell division protein FtsB
MQTTTAAPWFAFIGVALGFLLGEGSRYARYRWDIHRNRKLVVAELQAILAQLPQKRDILHQAIAHLNEQRFMPTLSCRTVTTGYYSVLEQLYPHLSLRERTCLHIIFERLRVADEQMDEFEKSFIGALKDKLVGDPWSIFSGRLQELLDSYQVVEDLARSYLTGEPIDVFGVEATA